MKIYLKGYYGYQNFWDELLLFGMIEEIFSRYQVEHLVIEVWNKERLSSRIEKNKDFILSYYESRNSIVDREKISFFEPHTFFKTKKSWFLSKRNQYFQIFLGNHPYRRYFKIFWGGEVIDESRSFPHNGRNLLLLYFRTIWKNNFALFWGLGSQNFFWTRRLTKFFSQRANFLYMRDASSYQIALLYRHNESWIQLWDDFSKNILTYFLNAHIPNNKEQKILLNLSPSFENTFLTLLQENIQDKEVVFFPCDMNYDIASFYVILPENTISIFDRRNYTISEILSLFHSASYALGSRLHFLYCCKVFGIPYIILSQSRKLETNLHF